MSGVNREPRSTPVRGQSPRLAWKLLPTGSPPSSLSLWVSSSARLLPAVFPLASYPPQSPSLWVSPSWSLTVSGLLPLSLTLCPGPHSGCNRRTMSSARAWQLREPSGRPGLWSWRGTWRPCGHSWGSSSQSSRTVGASERRPSVNSVSRTFGSASSWPRWDSPDPRCWVRWRWASCWPWSGGMGLLRLLCLLPRPPRLSRNFRGNLMAFGGSARLRPWLGQS